MTALSSMVVGQTEKEPVLQYNELHGMEMHTRGKENAVRELACFCYFIYDFIKRVVCLNHKAN